MKPNAARHFRNIGVFIGIVVLTVLLADRCTVGIPSYRRVAEVSGGDLIVKLTPQFPPPYHFVVAVPTGSLSPPPFKGTIEVCEQNGSVAVIPISSDSVEPCNWLSDVPGVSGYILAWNGPQQFSTILSRGTPYMIRVTFSQPLPAGCSLWFASMRHRSIVFNRNG